MLARFIEIRIGHDVANYSLRRQNAVAMPRRGKCALRDSRSTSDYKLSPRPGWTTAGARGGGAADVWLIHSSGMNRRLAGVMLIGLLCGCTSLLPRSKEVSVSPWHTYQEAQQTFDMILPGKTTAFELKLLSLDPDTNPNIAILNYSDVLRRFLMNQSVSLADLDDGVRECVMAKTGCMGYEINQKLVKKHRNGSFWLDFLGFKRETHTAGWRFQGLILMKEGVVVYKLTGGQPVIHETEENNTPLGPLQGVGNKFLGAFGM
jgi:hypothetical protein